MTADQFLPHTSAAAAAIFSGVVTRGKRESDDEEEDGLKGSSLDASAAFTPIALDM